MEIRIGDLVRVRGDDWVQKPLGIVTEIKELIHDQTQVEYRVITALVAGQYFTFSDADFELVGTAERTRN